MKYAIVETGGKQFKAVEGGTLEVDRLQVEAGQSIKLEQVLLLADGDSVTVGTPLIKDNPVWAKVLAHFKGPKVTIFNYSPKKRIRVKTGHRQYYTRLLVEQIGGAALVKKAPAVEKAAETKVEKAPKPAPKAAAKAAPKAQATSAKAKQPAAPPAKAKAAPKAAPKTAAASPKGKQPAAKPAGKPAAPSKGKPAAAAKPSAKPTKPAPKASPSTKTGSSPKGKKPAGK